MFVEYVQFLNEEGGISTEAFRGPLPWIALGVLAVVIVWTLKK